MAKNQHLPLFCVAAITGGMMHGLGHMAAEDGLFLVAGEGNITAPLMQRPADDVQPHAMPVTLGGETRDEDVLPDTFGDLFARVFHPEGVLLDVLTQRDRESPV